MYLFLLIQSTEPVNLVDSALVERCELITGNRDQFAEATGQVKSFLADKPFRLFEQSMYFHRYLQWKWLERLVHFPSLLD